MAKEFLKGIRKGALRAKAKARGMIKGDEKLSTSDLGILSRAVDATTRKEAVLAQNMRKWGK